MAALLLSACVATAPNVEGGRVAVDFVQLSSVPAAARQVSGGAPMQYGVRVENRTGDTIKLERINIQSLADIGPYVVPATTLPFDVQIPSNGARDVDFWVAAHLVGGSVTGANGPVTLRLVLHFSSPTGVFTETVVRQAHAARTSGGQ